MSSLAAALAPRKRVGAYGVVARDGLGTLALNVGATGLNFLVTVVLTHALGARGYGAYAFAFAWSTVLAVPGALGLPPLVIRSVARYKLESAWGLLRGVLRQSHLMALSSSLLIAALGALVGAKLLAHKPELLHPYLVALPLVPLLSLTAMRQAAMGGLGRVVLGRMPETVLAPGAFLLSATVAWIAVGDRFTPSVALALQVAAAASAFSVGIWLLRRSTPHEIRAAEPRYEAAAWRSSAARLVAMSLAGALSTQLAVILLAAFNRNTDAGVYQAASRTALFVSFVFMAAGYAVMPAIARLYADRRPGELQELVSRAGRFLFACSVPIAVTFLALAPQLLALFGGGFRGGSLLLRILVVGEVVRVATGFASAALLVAGYERDLMWLTAGGLALNLMLAVMLIPPLGGDGAAIAVTTDLVVVQLAMVVLASRRLGVSTAVIHFRRRPLTAPAS